jgi:hypothetical protein
MSSWPRWLLLGLPRLKPASQKDHSERLLVPPALTITFRVVGERRAPRRARLSRRLAKPGRASWPPGVILRVSQKSSNMVTLNQFNLMSVSNVETHADALNVLPGKWDAVAASFLGAAVASVAWGNRRWKDRHGSRPED